MCLYVYCLYTCTYIKYSKQQIMLFTMLKYNNIIIYNCSSLLLTSNMACFTINSNSVNESLFQDDSEG